MKFVEPKVVDSLSENGMLLAQDGEDVVKVPASKIGGNGGNDNEEIIYLEEDVYYGNEEFLNKILNTPLSNIYVISYDEFDCPILSSVLCIESQNSGSLVNVYYYAKDGSEFGIKNLDISSGIDM